MIENNERKEYKGFKIGQIVWFRYSGTRYRGEIIRLTNSKAYIRFHDTPHIDVKHVSYNQIEGMEV